ncbi:MAG TPA: nitroreductase family protein [Acidobacteriaceae bacterium]|nr:nitroreductase family protein [Acidobacteriaceae bacterium]
MQQTLKLIRDRYSERGAFDAKRPVAKADLKMILEAARWAPTPNNMQNFEIVVVDAKQQLEAIGKIPACMSEEYLRENYAETVATKEELRIRKRGMLASMFPAAWTDPQAWDEGSDARFQITFLGRAVQENPLLLIVLYDGSRRAPGSERDVLGHMGLGCVMENMWLMAEALGIAFRVLTVFGESQAEREIKKALHAPARMRVAFACALGYPVQSSVETYLRVRRDLEDFVHFNEFGRRDPGLDSELIDTL